MNLFYFQLKQASTFGVLGAVKVLYKQVRWVGGTL